MYSCSPPVQVIEMEKRKYSLSKEGRKKKRFPGPDLSLLNDSDVAYIAGFIDADGTIGLYPNSKGPTMPSVSVTNLHRGVIDWLKENIPGSKVYKVEQRPLGDTNVQPFAFRWVMYRINGIKAILELILPHLKVKGEQAIVMLNWINQEIGDREAIDTLKQLKRKYE